MARTAYPWDNPQRKHVAAAEQQSQVGAASDIPAPEEARSAPGARKRGGRARVSEKIGHHVDEDELLRRFAAGEALVAMTAFDGLDLTDVSAGAATFEQVVFRSCAFNGVDFSRCTFTDVVFSGCRFTGCRLERCWLNRCDFRACSAPGLSFLKSRLTAVAISDSQLRYADFSEAALEGFSARETSLAESVWHNVRPRRVILDACNLERIDVFRTPLAGVDLSTCEVQGITVSSDFRELRGCVMSPAQAVGLAGLLGVQVKEE